MIFLIISLHFKTVYKSKLANFWLFPQFIVNLKCIKLACTLIHKLRNRTTFSISKNTKVSLLDNIFGGQKRLEIHDPIILKDSFIIKRNSMKSNFFNSE